MALAVRTEKTKIIVLSKDFDGVLQPHHVALYIFADLDKKKLGEVWEATGKTPQQAVTSRYSGSLSARTSDLIIDYIIIIDKIDGMMKGYDNAVRRYIHKLFVREDIPFDALVGSIQVEDENTEALIGFNNKHLDILVNVIKDYCGIEQYFNTKEPFVYRFGQESAVEQGVSSLKKHGKCLFAGHTGFGKTSLSVKIANRYLSNGGIVLGLSPILDTIEGFRDAIEGRFCLGFDRNQEYGFVTSNNINREDLLRRKAEGEVVNVFMSIQDLTYDDIEKRYPQLNGIVDLIIEDEGHKHYGGEKTSKRLRFLEEVPILTLSATPYNIMDNFSKETIIDRGLMWALRNIEDTKIPVPFLEGILTPFSSVSDRLRSQYTIEEGFDPRKIVETENKNFVYQSDLEQLPSLWYEDTRSRRKNPLSVVNDTRLSSISKKVGLIVLPEGKKGDGAEEYLPRLASLWNDNSKGRYYITSYDVANQARSTGITVGALMQSLIKRHPQGVSVLTHRKFTTGTDIPLLGHIILLDKICDPKEFEQLMGRLIRLLEGKDHVGMYIACPDVEIQVTWGRMASKSVELSGGDIREVLENISLTGYDLEGNAVEYSPEDIISKIKEYYRSISRDKLNTTRLISDLLNCDLSGIDVSGIRNYKDPSFKERLTDSTGAKVGGNSSSGGGNGGGVKPLTIERIAALIQQMAVESMPISWQLREYDSLNILNDSQIHSMFNNKEVSAVLQVLGENPPIKKQFDDFLRQKGDACENLPLHVVHDEIYKDTKPKQGRSMVYVRTQLAEHLVDKLPERDVYVVPNALSGSIPDAIRRKHPDSKILCDEYFPHSKTYLTRVGFELMEDTTMSLQKDRVCIAGNLPFSDRSSDSTNSANLDSKIFLENIHVADYVADIIRSKHFNNPKSTFRKKLFSSGKIKELEYLSESYFPTINHTETCVVVYDANHSGDTKITYKDGNVVYRKLHKDSLIKFDNPNFSAEIPSYNMQHRWVRGKLNTNKMIQGDVPMVHTMGNKGKDLIITYVQKDRRNMLMNTHGVIMNSAAERGSLGKIDVKPYSYAISGSIVCLVTKSEDESIRLKEYLESVDITQIVKDNKLSAPNTKALFARIPDMIYE